MPRTYERDFDRDRVEHRKEMDRINNECIVKHVESRPYPETRDRIDITIYSIYMVWEDPNQEWEGVDNWTLEKSNGPSEEAQ